MAELEMRVRVDQARNDGDVPEVDRLGCGRSDQPAIRPSCTSSVTSAIGSASLGKSQRTR